MMSGLPLSANLSDIERGEKINSKPKIGFRSYCNEYCNYSGIHGVKYFGEKRTITEKFCWILVFALSLTVCIGVIFKTFQKWRKSPVIVNFATQEANIYDIPFPSVTICPETKSRSNYFNYSDTLKTEMSFLPDYDLKKLQYMALLCNENHLSKKIPKVNTTDPDGFYKFLEEASFNFTMKCVWMAQRYPCEELFQPIVTDEGFCMTFNMMTKEELFTKSVDIVGIRRDMEQYYIAENSENWSVEYGYNKEAGVETFPRRALLSGPFNSLSVTLATKSSDIDYACSSFQGYKIVLHKSVRFPAANQHFIRVPLQKAVNVAIDPQFMTTTESVKTYDVEKRKCFFQSEKKLQYFSNYTQHNCMLECLTDYALKICKCVAHFMPRRHDTPMCGNGKLNCLKRVKDKLQMSDLHYEIAVENLDDEISHKYSNMKCECLPMCSAIEYNVEISESDYGMNKVLEALGKDSSEEFTPSQLVLYFKQSHFIPLERNELYGLVDFLGSVGGLLGLFIGFSLLSLVEIIYFFTLRLICNLTLYKNLYGNTH